MAAGKKRKDNRDVDLDAFRLTIGTPLNIALREPDLRVVCKLIGFSSGRSVIVSAPLRDGKPMFVKEGRRLGASILVNQSVIGFESSILRERLHPYGYWHLEWPRELEQRLIRNARRVDISLICAVRAVGGREADSARAASMVDLSKTGCRIHSPYDLGSLRTELEVDFKTELSGVEQVIRLRAILRSKQTNKEDKQQWAYGLEFSDMNERNRALVGAFVNELILSRDD